jgi:phosphoribosylcarboxyaminoimidazole (NCAIR) mutase
MDNLGYITLKPTSRGLTSVVGNIKVMGRCDMTVYQHLTGLFSYVTIPSALTITTVQLHKQRSTATARTQLLAQPSATLTRH